MEFPFACCTLFALKAWSAVNLTFVWSVYTVMAWICTQENFLRTRVDRLRVVTFTWYVAFGKYDPVKALCQHFWKHTWPHA